jgi:uncharacterized protein (DUF952 family)
VSFASCSLAWCWQKRSSAPEDSLARTRAAAPQRSQRSALVSSELVKVAFMASPISRTFTVSDVCGFRVVPRSLSGVSFLTAASPPSGTALRWSNVAFAPGVFVHLCGVKEWARARIRGDIRPAASGSDAGGGFIHLSTPGQIHLPANRLYRGRGDLVLLHIDPALLDSPVRWEPGVATDPESILFPHLYGPLPLAAVIRVTAYSPGPDGTFPPFAAPQGSAGEST